MNNTTTSLAINFILLAIFCLVHSLMARDFIKQAFAKFMNIEFYRLIYVLVSIISLYTVLSLWRPITGELWHTTGYSYWALSIVSYACLFGGIYSIYVINYWEFFGISSLIPSKRVKLNQAPALSIKGPYGYCRHPMYLFFGLFALTKPIMTYSDVEFIIIAFVYVWLAIPFEERNLKKEIGKDYDHYCANVPKIIPRIKPWR